MVWKSMQRVREMPSFPLDEEDAKAADMQADGFLLSQFLSSSSNNRSDEYGGSVEKRTELVLRILRAVRREVPKSFCVGVKINAADHMSPGGFDEMLRQIELIHKENPDYIQLSGGSFENPQVCSFELLSTLMRAHLIIRPDAQYSELVVKNWYHVRSDHRS